MLHYKNITLENIVTVTLSVNSEDIMVSSDLFLIKVNYRNHF